MNPIERLNQYSNDGLDEVMAQIKYGRIKCGKYAHRVKIDKNPKIPKELFKDGEDKHQKK